MIIDISQEIFTCQVFPGDPAPHRERVREIERGDRCNLTAFSMCAHNGTHVDAPSHFLKDGKTLDEMELDCFVGDCYVGRCEGNVTAEDALRILEEARAAGARKRILIAGKATMTAEAAKVFAEARLKLLGNESQTFGPEGGTEEVHKILLGAEMILLEGIVLTDVAEGKYILSAAPLNLGGCEGAPVRAILIQ